MESTTLLDECKTLAQLSDDIKEEISFVDKINDSDFVSWGWTVQDTRDYKRSLTLLMKTIEAEKSKESLIYEENTVELEYHAIKAIESLLRKIKHHQDPPIKASTNTMCGSWFRAQPNETELKSKDQEGKTEDLITEFRKWVHYITYYLDRHVPNDNEDDSGSEEEDEKTKFKCDWKTLDSELQKKKHKIEKRLSKEKRKSKESKLEDVPLDDDDKEKSNGEANEVGDEDEETREEEQDIKANSDNPFVPPLSRSDHTFLKLKLANAADGESQFLVFGGSYEDPNADCVSFNDLHILHISHHFDQFRWEKLDVKKDDEPSPRSGAKAVQISDDEILFFGGVTVSRGTQVFFNEIHILNLTENSWKLVKEGKKMDDSYWNWLNLKIYGESAANEKAKETYPAPRTGHTLSLSKSFFQENKVVLVGGNYVSPTGIPMVLSDVWELSLQDYTWKLLLKKSDFADKERVNPFKFGISGHSAVAVAKKYLLIVGGKYYLGGTWQFYNELAILDLSQKLWMVPATLGEPAPSPRVGQSVIRFKESKKHGNDFLCLFGGSFFKLNPWSEEYYNDIHVLDLKHLRWNKISYKKKEKDSVPDKRDKAGFGFVKVSKKGKYKCTLFGGGTASVREKTSHFYNDLSIVELKRKS